MSEKTNKFGPAPGQLEAVRGRLAKKHVDEEILWTSCPENGCFDLCMLQVHKKNGVVTAIETDDVTCHKGIAREDEYVDWDDFRKGVYQHRACVRGRGYRQDVYNPSRILYPMKRVGPRGSRQFKRISWEEALDTVAQKYLETREKYGPLSVWCDGVLGTTFDVFGGHLPGGAMGGWAIDSFEPHDFADTFVYGNGMNLHDYHMGTYWGAAEGPTFLDAKAIVLWGVDVVLNYTEYTYHLMLAREKGIPLIVIEPRHTWTAHLADQWIPIRPATDGAMIEAICYMLFKEDRINHEFVNKWVEPKGLARFKAYLFGEDDGIEKTPEWAEKICGVPAETIAGLAKIYGQHPIYSRQVWAAARMHKGENQARSHNYLCALGGNIGHKGTAGPGTCFFPKAHIPAPIVPAYLLGGSRPQYGSRNVLESEMWAQAIHLHEKLERGEISAAEYKAEIGVPEGEETPNIKMLMFISMPRNQALCYYDANDRIAAMKKVDFYVHSGWSWNQTTLWYADIILPSTHQFFEGGRHGGYDFMIGCSQNIGNYITGVGRIVDPPGETRSKAWILKEIANRLGIGDLYAPRIKDLNFEETEKKMVEIAEESYNMWAQRPEIAPHNPPSWEEFKKFPFFQVPIKDYKVKFMDEFTNNKPLKTPSGKIEFYSEWLATKDLKKVSHESKTFGKGVISPMAKYEKPPYSLLSHGYEKTPLYMITPHAFYRTHWHQDDNPWFRDEYRVSVWVSAADAKARNIKDNDLVMVHNQVGQCILPAYVTNRLVPGVTCLIFGRQYQPSAVKTDIMPEGIDRAGVCNFLIPTEHFDARRGALLCTGMVQIEKVDSSFPVYINCEEK